jgi:hypothetical protein
MPVHWEPKTFEEFRRALDAKRCQVVPHRWTREWARKHGWRMWWFRFDRQFTSRVTSNEQDFWLAYNDGAFNLHLCEVDDMWGR